MADKVFFLAGLPRSGSTLLANVLAQNPRFQVTSTSCLSELIMGMKARFTASPQRMATNDHNDLRRRFRSAVAGAMHGFFPDAQVGIDKAREWMQHRRLLWEIYGPAMRVICPVRDLRGCLASQEVLYRQAPEAFWQDERMEMGVQDRAQVWMNSNPLGKAGSLIQVALQEGFANNGFVFVRMEDFASHPHEVMANLYTALEEKPYAHDFDNVQQTVHEHDAVHWPLGEHTLRGSKVVPFQRDYEKILGRELCADILSKNQWFYRAFYPEMMARQAA